MSYTPFTNNVAANTLFSQTSGSPLAQVSQSAEPPQQIVITQFVSETALTIKSPTVVAAAPDMLPFICFAVALIGGGTFMASLALPTKPQRCIMFTVVAVWLIMLTYVMFKR